MPTAGLPIQTKVTHQPDTSGVFRPDHDEHRASPVHEQPYVLGVLTSDHAHQPNTVQINGEQNLRRVDNMLIEHLIQKLDFKYNKNNLHEAIGQFLREQYRKIPIRQMNVNLPFTDKQSEKKTMIKSVSAYAPKIQNNNAYARKKNNPHHDARAEKELMNIKGKKLNIDHASNFEQKDALTNQAVDTITINTLRPANVGPELSRVKRDINEFYSDPSNRAMYLVLPLIILVYGGCASIFCIYKLRKYLKKRKRRLDKAKARAKLEKESTETDDMYSSMGDLSKSVPNLKGHSGGSVILPVERKRPKSSFPKLTDTSKQRVTFDAIPTRVSTTPPNEEPMQVDDIEDVIDLQPPTQEENVKPKEEIEMEEIRSQPEVIEDQKDDTKVLIVDTNTENSQVKQQTKSKIKKKPAKRINQKPKKEDKIKIEDTKEQEETESQPITIVPTNEKQKKKRKIKKSRTKDTEKIITDENQNETVNAYVSQKGFKNDGTISVNSSEKSFSRKVTSLSFTRADKKFTKLAMNDVDEILDYYGEKRHMPDVILEDTENAKPIQKLRKKKEKRIYID